MSAVIEQRDITSGLELVTGDEISLEATRYLFFAGDVIDPGRKDELEGIAEGGEELPNRCLKRTGGFLPKCKITALEFWGEPMALEHFPDGIRPYRLKDEQPTTDLNPTGRTLIGKPLLFMPLFPGDLIVDALGLASGERKGIIEITALRGIPYETGERDRVQSLFFPPELRAPIELRLVQERVEKVGDSVADTDVKSIANNMVASCEQFRRWAQEKIDKCHSQLDTRKEYQWTYRYSPQIRSLMKQLEIEPRNQGAQNLQAAAMQAIAQSGVSPEMFAQMQERDTNLVSKLGEVFAEALAKAFGGAKAENENV